MSQKDTVAATKTFQGRALTGLEFAVTAAAIAILSWEFLKFAYTPPLSVQTWLWGILAGSQMLLTKAVRIPVAPGKWIDFTYVPMWVVVFTLPAHAALLILLIFSLLIYALFPDQFMCKRTWNKYLFHYSYQIILYFFTIESFWLVKNHVSLSLGALPLTGTVAMFASMFGLMLADTLLGGWIQFTEGQKNVFKEWRNDYWRITAVQTVLSSLAMLFAYLFLTGHPIQLGVIYAFFWLILFILYRLSFRQDDFLGLARSIIQMVELKDTYTRNHSESVGHYSMVLGQMLGLSYYRLQRLYIAAQLHDIGKIGVPDEILKKEGPLTNEEFEIMKRHATFGENVLTPLKSLRNEAYIIGRHHERLDGSGYPYRAKADEIPLESKIISITDAYHAMISHRPYRRGIEVQEAIQRLQEGKGTQFDAEMVDLFCEYIKNPGKHTHRFRPFCLVH